MATSEAHLLHELPILAALRAPRAAALTSGRLSLHYAELAAGIEAVGVGLCALGLPRGARVGIYLDKRPETVIASFGATAAGGAFVPLNPLLKAKQVAYILRDCNVHTLITSTERYPLIRDALPECRDLHQVVIVGEDVGIAVRAHYAVGSWAALISATGDSPHRVIDTDLAAILYTSGSTGDPKGVMLSHRNMVAGAKSVASYLENSADDALLAALPLSFDAGFSQLTTAFHAGARVVLLNYLLPKDVLNALVRERITGLTAVPPLYIQLSQLEWPGTITEHLRYFANTGGRMPLDTLTKLRAVLPKTKPFLMYGLTEAFRATYLPPEEAARRPDSIGKAVPNAEILVLRPDGTPCAANEPGELVQRGALVGMGYWNDPERTAERYKPLPIGVAAREEGMVLPELAVFSGDQVRRDEEGFLYFIGRRDEMIKTSGYRVSPTEIEEVLYRTGAIAEAAAVGVAHPVLGQAIVVIVTAKPGEPLDEASVMTACREHLPIYMAPAKVEIRAGSLPRNPNGKIDRKLLAMEYESLFVAK